MTTTENPKTSRPRQQREAPKETEEIGLLDRIPPHNFSAEAAVLGSIIIDSKVIDGVRELIGSGDAAFMAPGNDVVFRVLCELHDAGKPIDAMILHSTLKTKNLLVQAGGMEHIKELAGAVPTSTHAEYYAAIVFEHLIRRQLITALTESLRECYDGTDSGEAIVDRANSRVFKIAERRLVSHPQRMSQIVGEVVNALDCAKHGNYTGLTTGFIELDNLTAGLQKGEVILIAARPSVGKTALAVNILEHVGLDLKKPCGIFSLEMSRMAIVQRMLCSRAVVDSHKLRRGFTNDDEKQRIGKTAAEISVDNIFIDDTAGLTLMELRTKAKRLVQKHGVELLLVDYIGLMRSEKKENRTQEVSSLSNGIKALARELNIPILLLSQLNRASENEQRIPRTADLRDSGSLEQDADVVILLHREAVMHRGDEEWINANPDKVNEALAIIAKQRNGPCETVKLTFLSGQTRFVNFNPGV